MIKITVTGKTGVGKTCVAFALKYYLMLLGFEVRLHDDIGDQDRPANLQYQALSAIAGRTVVEIYTDQRPR